MPRNRSHISIVTLCVATMVIAGLLTLSESKEAQATTLLEQYLEEVSSAFQSGAHIKYRGYTKARQEKVVIEELGCNLVLKRALTGNPRPKRATKPFIQHWRVPLHRVQADRIERKDYRHDVGPYAVGRANLAYYGFAVVLKTKGWDIEVNNRLGDQITREREIEILFNTERAARTFVAIIEDTSSECVTANLGTGEEWNRFPR